MTHAHSSHGGGGGGGMPRARAPSAKRTPNPGPREAPREKGSVVELVWGLRDTPRFSAVTTPVYRLPALEGLP